MYSNIIYLSSTGVPYPHDVGEYKLAATELSNTSNLQGLMIKVPPEVTGPTLEYVL